MHLAEWVSRWDHPSAIRSCCPLLKKMLLTSLVGPYCVVGRTLGLGVRGFGFKSWLCHFYLSDLGWVISTLWDSVSSFIKFRDLQGSFLALNMFAVCLLPLSICHISCPALQIAAIVQPKNGLSLRIMQKGSWTFQLYTGSPRKSSSSRWPLPFFLAKV